MNAQISTTAPQTAPAGYLQAAINAGLTPYMAGALTAARREPCIPEEYSLWEGDQAEFSEGYKAEAEAMAARRFGAMLAAMLGGDVLEHLQRQEFAR